MGHSLGRFEKAASSSLALIASSIGLAACSGTHNSPEANNSSQSSNSSENFACPPTGENSELNAYLHYLTDGQTHPQDFPTSLVEALGGTYYLFPGTTVLAGNNTWTVPSGEEIKVDYPIEFTNYYQDPNIRGYGWFTLSDCDPNNFYGFSLNTSTGAQYDGQSVIEVSPVPPPDKGDFVTDNGGNPVTEWDGGNDYYLADNPGDGARLRAGTGSALPAQNPDTIGLGS
jgi:hypothetical protein